MLIEIYKYANKRLSIPSGLFSFRRAPSTYEPNHRPSFLALILELSSPLSPFPLFSLSSFSSPVFLFLLLSSGFPSNHVESRIALTFSRQRPSFRSNLFAVQSCIEKDTTVFPSRRRNLFLLLRSVFLNGITRVVKADRSDT